MKKWFEDAWWSWGNSIYFRLQLEDNVDRLAFFDRCIFYVYNNSVRVDRHLNSIELQRQMLENMSNLQVKIPTLEPVVF